MQKVQENSIALPVIYSYTLLVILLITAVVFNSACAQHALLPITSQSNSHQIIKKMGCFLNIQKCVKGSSKQIQWCLTPPNKGVFELESMLSPQLLWTVIDE